MEHRGLTMMWGAVSPERGEGGGHMMIHNIVSTLPPFSDVICFLFTLIWERPHSNTLPFGQTKLDFGNHHH
jgi:hypothetical protein